MAGTRLLSHQPSREMAGPTVGCAMRTVAHIICHHRHQLQNQLFNRLLLIVQLHGRTLAPPTVGPSRPGDAQHFTVQATYRAGHTAQPCRSGEAPSHGEHLVLRRSPSVAAVAFTPHQRLCQAGYHCHHPSCFLTSPPASNPSSWTSLLRLLLLLHQRCWQPAGCCCCLPSRLHFPLLSAFLPALPRQPSCAQV
jgi:hypothetical protein